MATTIPAVPEEMHIGSHDRKFTAWATAVKAALEAAGALTHNFAAITAPTSGDDTGDGYDVGSRWIDVTHDQAFVCVDATAAAARWVQMTTEVLTPDFADGTAVAFGDADNTLSKSLIVPANTLARDGDILRVTARGRNSIVFDALNSVAVNANIVAALLASTQIEVAALGAVLSMGFDLIVIDASTPATTVCKVRNHHPFAASASITLDITGALTIDFDVTIDEGAASTGAFLVDMAAAEVVPAFGR